MHNGHWLTTKLILSTSCSGELIKKQKKTCLPKTEIAQYDTQLLLKSLFFFHEKQQLSLLKLTTTICYFKGKEMKKFKQNDWNKIWL